MSPSRSPTARSETLPTSRCPTKAARYDKHAMRKGVDKYRLTVAGEARCATHSSLLWGELGHIRAEPESAAAGSFRTRVQHQGCMQMQVQMQMQQAQLR
jgi:hypothetical protein